MKYKIRKFSSFFVYQGELMRNKNKFDLLSEIAGRDNFYLNSNAKIKYDKVNFIQIYVRLVVVPIVLFLCVLIQGCATGIHEDYTNVPFDYVPSPPGNETISVRIGMEKLVDKRPESDRSVTKMIVDVDEKVTAKLLEDFRSSRIFESVDYPVQKEDALIIKGEIRRFYWEDAPTNIGAIPVVGFSLYFGAPTGSINAEANLCVQLINSKTGQVVAEYDKIAERKKLHNLYNYSKQHGAYKTEDGTEKWSAQGTELAEAFWDVSNQIKESIISDYKQGRLIIPQ